MQDFKDTCVKRKIYKRFITRGYSRSTTVYAQLVQIAFSVGSDCILSWFRLHSQVVQIAFSGGSDCILNN